MTARRSLRNNFVASAISNTARAGFGFAASVVVTRSLGATGRGKFSFVLNTLGVLVMLAGSGSFTALTRSRVKDNRTPDELYRASAYVALGLGVVGAGVLGLSYTLLSNGLFSGIGVAEVAWVGCALPLTLVLNFWTAVAALEDRVAEFALATLAGTGLYLVAVISVSTAGRLTFTTAVPIWIICSLIPLVTVIRSRRVRWSRDLTGLITKLLRFGARANLADLGALLVLRADVFVVRGLRGFRELGIYAVAVGVAEVLLQIGIALRVSLLPMQGSADRAAARDTLCRTARISLLAGALGGLALGVLAHPVVVGLYGRQFGTAATALILLLPGIVALVLQAPLRDYVIIEGVTVAPAVTAFCALGANVALNLWLLRNHTFLVAAGLSSLAYLANLAVTLHWFRRLTAVAWRDLLIPRREDVQLLIARLSRR